MPHCNATKQINSRSMTLNSSTPARTVVKTAVRNFESIARNPLLCSPDVDSDVSHAIGNGDILQWDTSKGPVNYGAFVNVTPQSASIVTSPNAKEFFIANGGNDGSAGDTSAAALLTFQRALYHAGKSDAFDAVTFYVTGDVVWNPASTTPGYRNQSRLREGSFGGNLSTGIIIRGLNSVYGNALTASDPPRVVTSQLVAQTPQTSLEFAEDATYTLSTAVAYNLNIAATEIVPFYRDTSAHYYPVAFDTTAHTTTKRRVYLSTTGSQPDVSAAGNLRPYKFAGKVTMNNSGTTANPGFSMTGNVQFVEVHFELQDGVKTPYHVNGEFTILYSMFTKTSGSDGATLELSASGSGNDHLSTLRIDPTSANSEGKPIIHVFKSIFQDLTIKFDTSTQIQDCVFIGCSIQNAEKCEFKGCTFFNCGIGSTSAINLGDDSADFSFESSAKFTTCQFQYSVPETSLATVTDGSSLELKDVVIRATSNTNVAQTKPLVIASEGAKVTLTNVKVNGKLNNEGTEKAAIVDANGSSMSIEDVEIIGGAGSLPLFYSDAGSVKLYDIKDACTNTGPLLRTDSSDIQIINFDIASADYTVVSGGIFEFNSSSVKINGIFGLIIKGGVVTTQTIFNLNNTVFKNFPADVSVGGKCNIQNTLTKHSIKAAGSQITLGITHTTPQINVQGAIDLENSECVITCSQAATASINYQGASGAPTLSCNNSNLSIKNIDIDGTGGGGCTALDANNNSTVTFHTCGLNCIGYTGTSLILVDNSHLSITDGNIVVAAANNEPCVNITNNSKFVYKKGTGGGSILTADGTVSTSALSVTNNSSAYLEKVGVTTDVATMPAIILDNHSSLVGIGTNGSPESYASTAAGTTDAVVDATNHSSVSLTDMNLASNNSSPGIGIKATNLSEVYGRILTGTDLQVNGSVVFDFNTKVHLAALATSGTAFSGSGYTTGGTVTQAWSTIVGSPYIFPVQGGLVGGWNAVKGCVITYTA